MSENHLYIWRCVKCNNHFANIDNADGLIKQEKKCPKCKSINTLKFEKKEILISCKFYDPVRKSYHGKQEEIVKAAI
jgi:phage FluMu protein Com